MTAPWTRTFALVAGRLTLAGITFLLYRIGEGALSGPPLLRPPEILTWWQQRGAVLATFSTAREVLFWVACYLCTLSAAGVVARATHSARLAHALSGCRLPGAKTMMAAAVGVSAVGAVVAAGAGPSFASDGSSPSNAQFAPLADGSKDRPVLRYVGPAEPAPVLRYVGPADPAPVLRYVGPADPAPVLRYVGPADPAPVLRYVGPAEPAPVLGYTGAGGGAGAGTDQGSIAPALKRTDLPPADAPGREVCPNGCQIRHPNGQTSLRRTAPAERSVPNGAGAEAGSAEAGSTEAGSTEAGAAEAGAAEAGAAEAGAAEAGAAEAGAAGGAASGTAGSGNTDVWVVRPGDDLWSIAEATLARAWGHPPADADLARYWWRVVQTNRADLPEPANPSLLFPGDRIAIPPPPAAPG